MNPTVEELAERPALGIRCQVRHAEIGNRMGELIPQLMAVAGPHVRGPVLARWHSWDGDGGEMEVAVPVADAMEGRGDVRPTTLPGGKALVVMHVGPYDGLKAAWTALGAWMQEHGEEGREAPWEEYLDDPCSVPPSELQTRIVWPIL